MNGTFKKILWAIGLILVVVTVYFYFGNYSEGTQAGVIMKIQKKGVVFKTWEGRLDMGTVGKSDKESLGSKIFEFSIDGNNQQLLQELTDAQLSGARVNLEFVQKYYKFSWNGETKFFAKGVKYLQDGVIHKNEGSEIPGLE